jgi:hypothetical protein
VTYYAGQEDGLKVVKRAIEDECVQAAFISLAADFEVNRL